MHALENYSRQVDFDHSKPENFDEFIRYHERSRKLFFETNHQDRASDALRGIADMHLQQGKLDQAERELLEVVAKFKIQNLQYPYDLLAEVSYRKGDQSKELLYRLKSFSYTESTNSKATDRYWRYSSIANLSLQLNQNGKALYFANKTLNDGRLKTGDMVYYCSLLFAADATIAERKFQYAYTFWIFLSILRRCSCEMTSIIPAQTTPHLWR